MLPCLPNCAWADGNWQNWLSSWPRWWNIPNQNQPNPGSPGDGTPCRFHLFPHPHLELDVTAEGVCEAGPFHGERHLPVLVLDGEGGVAEGPVLVDGADDRAGRGLHLDVLEAAREAGGLAVEGAVQVYHLLQSNCAT